MRRVLPSLALAFGAAFASAQPATPEQRAGVPGGLGALATLHLQTNVGSFRLIDGLGRVEISFSGSILFNQVKGFDGGKGLKMEGNLRKEYEGNDRLLLSGTGRVVVTGRWRGIQWFGTNMRAVWYGRGMARISGEFDRNLETGWYWYDNPKVRNQWMAGGSFTVLLPEWNAAPTPVPRARPAPPLKAPV